VGNALLAKAYEVVGRRLFGDPEHGDWIYERIQTPRSILAAAVNVLYYKIGQPQLSNMVSVQIEPVYACNLSCKYCPRQDVSIRVRPKVMALEVFHRAIDGLPNTVETVQFALLGEPLLHPKLGEMIDYVHRRRRRAIVYTNATLLRGERLEMLVRSRVDVLNISVEMDPELFKQIRGVDLDVVRDNVSAFIQRKAPGTEVKLSAVVHEHNLERVPRLYEHWTDLIQHFKVFPTWSIGPAHPAPLCLELWRGNLNVWSDGNVSPCCFDPDEEMVIGNVLKQSLAHMIRGRRMTRLMQGMLDGRPVRRCLHCYRFEGYAPGFHVRWRGLPKHSRTATAPG
jgi:MoaA/NifB/PqqE/SkfB family radical SAM enzyme